MLFLWYGGIQQIITIDCYFCSVVGIVITYHNSKNKKVICYPNLSSAIRAVGHSEDLPIPEPPDNLNSIPMEVLSNVQSELDQPDDEKFQCQTENSGPKRFKKTSLTTWLGIWA